MLCWALLRFREGALLFATAAVDKSLLRQEARHSTSIMSIHAEQKAVMWSMQRFEALSKLMRIAEVDELVVELPKS